MTSSGGHRQFTTFAAGAGVAMNNANIAECALTTAGQLADLNVGEVVLIEALAYTLLGATTTGVRLGLGWAVAGVVYLDLPGILIPVAAGQAGLTQAFGVAYEHTIVAGDLQANMQLRFDVTNEGATGNGTIEYGWVKIIRPV